jgi:ComEC/Rec2-related protein
MKILYITNYQKSFQVSGGYINDYLNDLLFYGLTELENVEVIDSTPIIHLYKENQQNIPLQTLWGKGFTSTYLINKDNIDRSNIEEKIKDKYFDLIIYGSINRCSDYYDIVSKIYLPNQIFLIDGDDSLIPKQLLNAYASTGTLHVLAVSGMHVGLIYALIGFALFWMKLPAFKIPKLLLQLTLVWLYAILCGFSPSIIRAAIMISLHAFAACTDRPQQQINVLFSSAFVMLFLNPNLLFDAGFQLSFCAVLGLLTLYQPICRIWPIDNKWVIPVWKLSAASIAAQLATLPLAVYHFHQFPMLFLPANLLVVPVCTLCIYWGLLLVSIPNLPDAIWNALASTIELINQFTLHLAAFRWVKIDYLYLSESVAIIFAMAIVGLVISIKNKSGLFLQLAICCFLLIQIQLFVKKYAIYTHPFIRVYAYNNHPCLAIVAGMQSVIVTDSVCSIEKPFTMGLKLDGIYTCNIVKIKQNSPSIHIKNYSQEPP